MTENDYVKIVEETKPTVLAAVRKYLFKSYYEYIDDVCQEVYFKAYKGLTSGKFRGDAKVSTWLYRIAVNESLMMNRHLSRKQKLFERAVSDYAANMDVPDYESEKMLFNELMASLTEQKRKIFSMFMQNTPLNEIAAKMSMNESTVKSVIYRTKKQFIKLINGANFD